VSLSGIIPERMGSVPEQEGPASVLPPGEESGSAPGDRTFRPDVEGLRTVAVLLVVLYHAGLSWLPGGYVGVDVFFVISGYVITGVLLRERSSSGTTSLLGFYARRCRRILPAATIVLVSTMVVAHLVLGEAAGRQTADDAKWAAVFLANFHFASVGTNYLSAQLPPSPLQNLWTLSVEEQFYLVFPTLFLVVATLRTRFSLRTRLLAVLGALGFISLAWSVVETSVNPNAAYFSPFTRAWELALGAMVALAAPWLSKIPAAVAAGVTWVGLGAVIVAGVVFTAATPYPGIAVSLPVVGAAMVIAGGTADPTLGAERLLGLRPARALGRLSYSLYLWHWPILILAAEHDGRSSLPFSTNLRWLAVALVASVATYSLVENPVRHSGWLRRRSAASVGIGLCLIAITFGTATIETPAATSLTTAPTSTNADLATVEQLVGHASAIKSVPSDLDPPLQSPDIGYPPIGCYPISYPETNMKPCLFGDTHGSRSMVLYGDSHSGMWFQTIDDIAKAAHWKLWYMGKSACPVELLPMSNPGNFGKNQGTFVQCATWHSNAIARINKIRPDLVVVTQEVHPGPGYRYYSDSQWSAGLEAFFSSITVRNVKFDVIGNIPLPRNNPSLCLHAHSSDVQACSEARGKATSRYAQAEEEAVTSVGGRYIDVTPWFCSASCSEVIGKYQVYFNQDHVMGQYATFLQGVMADALRLPNAPFHLAVEVLRPLGNATLHGLTPALAVTSGGTTSHVAFVLSTPGRPDVLVTKATPTLDGWVAYLNTASVPNGTYVLKSRVSEGRGSGVSAGVRVRIDN
jgi:peptidoglycan/LPS O-acetylase OafA/YrhL